MPRPRMIPARATDSPNRAGNTATTQRAAIHGGTAVSASNRGSNAARRRQPAIPPRSGTSSKSGSAATNPGTARINVPIGKVSLLIAGTTHCPSSAGR